MADTVYKKSAEGGERTCAHDVLITEESPVRIYYLERFGIMVFSRSCNADQKGESLQAAYSSPDDRRAIVRNWIQQGITAKVTTVNGDTYNVHNISLDYAPPENYLLVCGVFGCDDPRVNMSVVDRKGSSPRSILFKDIDRIFVNKYGMLGLILQAGEKFEELTKSATSKDDKSTEKIPQSQRSIPVDSIADNVTSCCKDSISEDEEHSIYLSGNLTVNTGSDLDMQSQMI